MRRLWVLALGACLAVPALPAAPLPKYVYLPVGIFYIDGALKTAKVYSEQVFDDADECMANLQSAMLKFKESSRFPNGGEIIAACMPVFATVPTDM